jgi:hypothetical protein
MGVPVTLAGKEDLDQVHRVQKTGHLNAQRHLGGEAHEVSVDEVKHAVGGVDLGGKLSNHGGSQDHGNTRANKKFVQKIRKSKNDRVGDGSSGKVGDQDNQNNQELT